MILGQRQSELDATIRAIAAMGLAHKNESSKVMALLLNFVSQVAQKGDIDIEKLTTVHFPWREGKELGNIHTSPTVQAITEVEVDNEDIDLDSQKLPVNKLPLLPIFA